MTRDEIDEMILVLAADEVRNCSVINFVRDRPLLGVERAGNSILVRGRSDHDWIYISSESEEELGALVGRLAGGDDYFAAIEDWMVPSLCRGREMDWRLQMVRFALPGDVSLPKIAGEIETLVPEDASYIYDHSMYKKYITVDYARDCILGGPSVAIREGGVLAAWVMTQDDGAMGFLQVLEPYRRKGYGRTTTIALARELRRRKRLPFAYVAEDNHKAIALVSSLGFVRDRRVQWFQLR